MSNWFGCKVLLLFAIIVYCDSAAALYEGDKCSLNDASEGICKFIKECPAAIQSIKKGVNPIVCGFEGTESIVCCKNVEEITNTTSTTTTTTTTTIRPSTTTTTTSNTTRRPGDISKQKCKEYADYAYEKIYSPTLLPKPQFKKNLVCGIPRNKLKVGSVPAGKREFPHMALIGLDEGDRISWQCGGSLISENYILTAAHCASSRVGPAKLVRLGITNKSDHTHMQERTISDIIIYPEYKLRYHDIALLKLSENVKINTYVRPACLQQDKFIPYDLAIAAGWGVVEYAGKPSNDLLEVVIEFFSPEQCNNTYRREILTGRLEDGIVDDLMICAGSNKAVRTSCQGDSGGPLQVYHWETEDIKCMYDIIGVISYGKSCGLVANTPVVHTRVSYYIKWIEDTVWPS